MEYMYENLNVDNAGTGSTTTYYSQHLNNDTQQCSKSTMKKVKFIGLKYWTRATFFPQATLNKFPASRPPAPEISKPGTPLHLCDISPFIHVCQFTSAPPFREKYGCCEFIVTMWLSLNSMKIGIGYNKLCGCSKYKFPFNSTFI